MGGRLVVRSNWPIYLEEMHANIASATALYPRFADPNTLLTYSATNESHGSPTTRFEIKYRRAGLPLFQLEALLGPRLRDSAR